MPDKYKTSNAEEYLGFINVCNLILALGGSQGVKSVFDHFKKELEMVMQLAGTKTIDEVK